MESIQVSATQVVQNSFSQLCLFILALKIIIIYIMWIIKFTSKVWVFLAIFQLMTFHVAISDVPDPRSALSGFTQATREGPLVDNTISKAASTERPLPQGKPYCSWSVHSKDDCNTDSDCKRVYGISFRNCVRSKGPNSKKICCMFVIG